MKEVKTMPNQFSRTQLLLGKDGMEKLHNAHVAVFGVGGVGGYVIEALVRSGVGKIDIFDNDTVSLTNLNRQIIATHDTIGRYKVDVMKERALSINPEIEVNAYNCFYMPENADEYDLAKYSYIVDAIDTVTAKIELIVRADKAGVPIISSMGAGNKLNPSLFEVSDIYKTSVCPLARTMRRELKQRGIKKLKVVYSKEAPIKPVAEDLSDAEEAPEGRRALPGSTAFVPAAAGLVAAGEVICDLVGR